MSAEAGAAVLAGDQNAVQPSDRSRRIVGAIGAVSLISAFTILFSILWPLKWNLLAFWAAIEAIFYIFYFRPRYAELSSQPRQHQPAAQQVWAVFNRMLRYFKETKGSIDYEMYYSGWFLGAKFEDIKRGNCP